MVTNMLKLAELEQAEFDAVLDRYMLWDIWKRVLSLNESGTIPYHNTYHAQNMVLDCLAGARWSGVPFEDTRLLLIAAIVHDVNHSGGKELDDANIMMALSALLKLQQEGLLSAEACEVCSAVIVATQYPYLDLALRDQESGAVTPEYVKVLQNIIRDADLCAMLGSDWVKHVIYGLRVELAVSGKTLPVELIANAYWQFYSGSQKHSDWGKHTQATYNRVIAERLELVKEVVAAEGWEGLLTPEQELTFVSQVEAMAEVRGHLVRVPLRD